MSDRGEVRQRIIEAAAELLDSEGRDAVTTRAVSAAAGVQPPTIYRLFTDMGGLLEAVAASGFEEYLQRKLGQALTDDPVEDLRAGWNLHVEFGLEKSARYLLIYAQPDRHHRNPAVERAIEHLRLLVSRVAEAGRLAVGIETGVGMMQAAGAGATLTLISMAPEDRDLDLSRRLREATIAAITGEEPAEAPDYARRAAGLQAVLGEADGVLSGGERALLDELLDRLANADQARNTKVP